MATFQLRVPTLLIIVAGCQTDTAGRDAGLHPLPPDAGIDALSIMDAAPVRCPATLEGAPCDDGNLCTVDDVCTNGMCVGTPKECVATHACAMSIGCNPSSGRCEQEPAREGQACDDDNVCTLEDVCRAGVCGGRAAPVLGERCERGICFSEIAAESGIDWTSATPGQVGGTAAFVDYDNDGHLDLILASEATAPTLFRNDGDGTFSDRTLEAGLALSGASARGDVVAVADIDNDGDADVYIGQRGATNKLFRNDNGVFTDITVASGTLDPGWTTAAAFGDFDRDGLVDLFLGNYVESYNFPNHTAQANRLLRNLGDGTFHNVTAEAGVAGAGTTLAATWSDYDGDGWPDLLVCNDFGATVQPNQLWRNTGFGFVDVSHDEGLDLALYCMSITPGDWDRDQDLDYYFTNMGANAMMQNGPEGFMDVGVKLQIDETNDRCFQHLLSASWAAAFHDFNRDGWLDLYVANGWMPAAPDIANAPLSANTMLVFDPDTSRFVEISATAGVDHAGMSRGAAFGDVDRDGDIDIVQMDAVGKAMLLRNDSPASGFWLQVAPTGRISNRDALGTRVAAHVSEATLIREISHNYGYMGSSQGIADFGLGTHARVDVSLRWPSGVTNRVLDVSANQKLHVLEPLVTLDWAEANTATPDQPLGVTLQLRNHNANAVSVACAVALDMSGATVGTASATTSVPGTSVLPTQITVDVPMESAGQAGYLTISVEDNAGSIDQRRIAIDVASL